MIILVITLVFAHVQAYNLTTLQNRRNQSLFKDPLPSLAKGLQVDQEQILYDSAHKSFEFREFDGDPRYNAKFTLQNSRKAESFYFIGQEAGEIKIEVLVINNAVGKLPGIKLYLIDHTEKQILKSLYISHVFTFLLGEINSNLFELRIQADGNLDFAREIDMKMSVRVPTPISSVDEEIRELMEIMEETADKIDNTFLGSLEQWDRISRAMHQRVKDQNERTNMFLLEMLTILAVNLATFLLLRRQLNKKILV